MVFLDACHNRELCTDILNGLAEIDAGSTAPHETVLAKWKDKALTELTRYPSEIIASRA
jgi:predicted transcriptional regulator